MTLQYEAPKLTKYGKVSEFVQAGSVVLGTGDVTGDGVPDTLYATNGGLGDLVVGGANGGRTPVTERFIPGSRGRGLGSDADGDGLSGIIREGSSLRPSTGGNNIFFEPAEDDGWNDPARD